MNNIVENTTVRIWQYSTFPIEPVFNNCIIYYQNSEEYKYVRNANFSNCTIYFSDNSVYNCNFYNCTFKGKSQVFDSCIIQECDLSKTDVIETAFCGVDFKDSYFGCTTLSEGSYFSDCKNIPLGLQFITHKPPRKGSFYGYKKLYLPTNRDDDYFQSDFGIAKLYIPYDAYRSSGTSNKCRASKAIVKSIYDKNGNCYSYGTSCYDATFRYRVNTMVYPRRNYCSNRWLTCVSGIHFFMTEKEAWNYKS